MTAFEFLILKHGKYNWPILKGKTRGNGSRTKTSGSSNTMTTPRRNSNWRIKKLRE